MTRVLRRRSIQHIEKECMIDRARSASCSLFSFVLLKHVVSWHPLKGVTCFEASRRKKKNTVNFYWVMSKCRRT